MKTIKISLLYLILLIFVSCDQEVVHYDFEKYKFVSFIDTGATVPETYSSDSGNAYPIYLRYDGSVLEEDFTVNVKITAVNSQEDIDYNVESTAVVFKAGEIRSEPLLVTIVDNLLNAAEDRSLLIEIESASNPAINIGVGIVNQANKSFVLSLIDDECSETISIYNSATINSSAGNQTIVGSVLDDIVTLKGNLIDYGAFPNATLGIKLTPSIAGGTSGVATFDDYPAGTDNDGYVYEFRQNGTGVFNICSGEITVAIDVYYESGGSWVFWYTSNNIFSLE